MFSWKKQNPPSKQRAAAVQDTEDYSNLIAQGLKLANEDIDQNDDYMEEDGDLDDMDLDDPDLLVAYCWIFRSHSDALMHAMLWR